MLPLRPCDREVLPCTSVTSMISLSTTMRKLPPVGNPTADFTVRLVTLLVDPRRQRGKPTICKSFVGHCISLEKKTGLDACRRSPILARASRYALTLYVTFNWSSSLTATSPLVKSAVAQSTEPEA